MLPHASSAHAAVTSNSDPSIDDLDRAITSLAAQLNAVTHDFLILVRRFDERAGWLGWGFRSCVDVELPMETGELVDKALDQAVETTASSTPELAEESWAAQRADALVALAQTYLGGSGGGEAATGTSDHYQVVVHVDESALRGGAGRAGLPIESLRRIGCDASRFVLVENAHGEPLSIGRKSRVVPQAIKRALWARDLGCRFPGCGRRRFVDAHHIEHWSAGGETSLANLMLLCSKHHTLVHEGGFHIEKDYRDRWFFRRPDGRAVPACGYRAADMRDDDRSAEDEYFAVQRSAHPSAEGSGVAEPSAEVYRARSVVEGVGPIFGTYRNTVHRFDSMARTRPGPTSPERSAGFSGIAMYSSRNGIHRTGEPAGRSGKPSST